MGIGARLVRGLGVSAFLLGGIVFGVASSVVAPTHAYAQSANVVVEGNRRVEVDTIRSYFRPGPGGRFDAATIDQGLKGLYATGLFQDVRIRQAGGRLIVTVIENPVINRIAFEGNKRVKDEQLTLEVQSRARGTFSRPTVQSDVQRIVEIYRRAGRFDVSVTPKVIELPNNRVDLVFEIVEGQKTGVKKIRFVGNKSYADQRLKDAIKTTETNFLSFLKNSDIYDPDRIEADRDLLRRFYLKHGFADVQVVSAAAEYDPGQKGFIVTFTIEEGARYRFGTVDILSNVRAVNPEVLRSALRIKAGEFYNAEAVEKSVEDMSIAIAKYGYPFASVRPRGDRDFEGQRINVVFVVEEGARAYIERIQFRGNTRTRDYVIRREFDIAEGDAYNRALVDRAERRLKNLNFFKSVKITNEPGSAPDRVVLNVEVEETSTGEFSIGGGYSTADGFMAEASIGERNLLGRGQYARAAVQYGERARGVEIGFVEPYLMGYRVALGLDAFAKERESSNYQSYSTKTIGGGTRLGFTLREDLALQLRYQAYQQEITLPSQYNNCSVSNKAPGCYNDGEASLPVRLELAQGPVLTSLVGYTLVYNTLDNNKNPTRGIMIDTKQDFAGVGGDVNYIRSTVDTRFYTEMIPDIVTVFRLQGGHIAGWGGKDVRMLDHFKMGPNLVRGFASAGLGPRDLTSGTTQDALGGTMYWGASVEFQVPLYFIPKDVGMRGAVYADAGSLWDYKGPVSSPNTGESILLADSNKVRSSVGVGLIWDSPFGPLRFDYAIPLTKEGYDRVQEFRFSGGTRF
ncbi:MAG: outer membrane protein assembly factor BamA [Pseudorhodoplanes sp.]|nr:outer membrane protein assembly factor BamA [Pseudorhodoplanes sp.]